MWSDGVPVTADDFVFSLRRILDPKLASEYASLIYVIKNAQGVNEGKLAADQLGVRALSPKVLEITLEHPAPYLTELAKHQTMLPVPKHVVEKWGDAWTQPANYISNGPYMLKSWTLGDHVNVVKNPRFYDAKNVCIDQINFYPTNDAIGAERRVRRGELDMNADIQSNRIAFLRERMPDYVHTSTYLGVAYLAFNTAVPAFKDKRVRLALNMSIDREFITGKLLRAGQIPAYAFEIKHRNSPDPMLFMPAIQADWKEVGVETALMQNETQIAYAAYRSRDFQVADAAWIADYNDAMSFLYLQQSSTGAQNYGDYKNPAFDALLAKADT